MTSVVMAISGRAARMWPTRSRYFSGGVGAVHRLEDAGGAGLKRQMDVLDQLRQPRERLDQILPEADGMRRGEPDALNPLDPMDRLEQLDERRLPVPYGKLMPPVQIDDLPQQRHLPHAARRQSSHLFDDLRDSPGCARRRAWRARCKTCNACRTPA